MELSKLYVDEDGYLMCGEPNRSTSMIRKIKYKYLIIVFLLFFLTPIVATYFGLSGNSTFNLVMFGISVLMFFVIFRKIYIDMVLDDKFLNDI